MTEIREDQVEERQELDRIAKMLVRRDFALMEVREKREVELEELRKIKAELEEAKTTLEARVEARTRELRELAQSLEGQVEGRTRELREKVEELERMNKLMLGRELKMVELKGEIRRLKEELERRRPR